MMRKIAWARIGACGLLLGLLAAASLLLPVDRGLLFQLHASGGLLDRNGALLHATLNRDEAWCFPRPLSGFSQTLVQATLAAEDRRFYAHPGVDPIALARAAWGNASGGVRSGASTLTMQAVNLAGHRSSSLPGKIAQAHAALRLDLREDKDAILALYLNKAPYGFNLIGAEAASRRYFGKSANELTLPEAALLAGMPKAPSRFQPLRNPGLATQRRAYVLRRMEEDGYITTEARHAADAAPLGAAWHDFPQHAPHLAARHAPRLRDGGTLQLTLDRAIQAQCEATLQEYLRRYNNEITNAACVVVDVASGAVLARVGSAGYHTVADGQVDMCAAGRSPGSALKPFTYAVALEQGLLYPTEKLLDDTLDFGAYAPDNFDGIFNGLVSASQALQMSLNVPAVATLDRIGLNAMQTFLESAGISTLVHSPSHYGLGLTLGNCEIQLEQLCGAYTMLANLGLHRPLRLMADAPPQREHRLLRQDTALALFKMLEHPFPREQPANFVKASTTPPRACWKTGTSTGFHDAWTVAFNRQYVVGVWVGNSNGRPSPRLVGALAALPLAATLFRSLPESAAPAWPDADGLEQTARVCALSGLPEGVACPHIETVLLPAGQFLNRKCDVHYPTAEGGVMARWPADARHWDLARIGDTVIAQSAAHAPERSRALKIVSPADSARYVVTGEPTGDRVLLRASVEDGPLHWYLNGAYLGESSDTAPIYVALAPGEHTLTCMAPEGISDTVRYSVSLP